MDSAQAEFFLSNGYLRLPAFHSTARLAAIRRRLLDETKRLVGPAGVLRSVRGLPVFQQIGRLSAAVKVPDLHDVLVTPALIADVTRLAGRAPNDIQPAQLLLSPSHQGAWTLDGLNWHVDIKAERPDRIPGIQAFFLIDDVPSHGGATLALGRSHRVVAHGADSPSHLRKVLKAHDNLEEALQKLGVTIVEMCGRAGDVFLIDMRLLHTPSINATKHVRLTATCRCLFNAAST